MTSRLFSPITIRGVTSPNRIMVSPMQQYASPDARAQDHHLVQLGRFAMGGAGMVIAEATAIEPSGRISGHDLGLWSDDQIAPLARIAQFIAAQGSVPGIQLIHAGRKGSVQPPWRGLGPLGPDDAAIGDPPWQVVGPSPVAAGPGWPVPVELSLEDIARHCDLWADAAKRAVTAGFRIIDLHGAHGYLLHAFLSPVSNQRMDRYGGDIENRMRYPLDVVTAIRKAIPDDIALFYRLSLLDGIEGGWTMEDSAIFARRLADAGGDVIDCSSGGIIGDRSADIRIRRGWAFHAPYSRRLRQDTGVVVSTVGLIVDAHQAEAILTAGDADIVAIGREMLVDPNWAHGARRALEGEDYDNWPRESGWWLDKRAASIRALEEAGETQMSRYAEEHNLD